MDEALTELRAKYIEMRAMRRDHESGVESGAHARMRRLAKRFPGALREIDTLPLSVIDARIAALEAGTRPSWALTQVSFHGWMRVCLRIRRGHRPASDPELVRGALQSQYRPGPGEPPLCALDTATIAAILKPPGRRLSRWVLERIARDRGLSLEEVSSHAFGTGND